MLKGIIELKIGNETLTIDTELETRIHDVSADMDTVSARISFFGEALAAAEEESVIVDAKYRQWRAREKLGALKGDEKLADWKLNAQIEASDAFMQYKMAIAKAAYNTQSLKSLIDALKEKSPNLRSKGARQRAELDATDMVTKTSEDAEIQRALRARQAGAVKKQPVKRGE
jgi:hypothetical protein